MNREFKVLLIDDDPIDQMFLKKSLSKEIQNLDLVSTLTGGKALELLEQTPYVPDLIITDHNMPGLSGVDLIKCIRTNERLMMIPVIMMSTSDAQSDIDAAYSSNVTTYIQKPMDLKGYKAAAKSISEYWCKTALLPSRCA